MNCLENKAWILTRRVFIVNVVEILCLLVSSMTVLYVCSMISLGFPVVFRGNTQLSATCILILHLISIHRREGNRNGEIGIQ